MHINVVSQKLLAISIKVVKRKRQQMTDVYIMRCHTCLVKCVH